MITTNLYEDFAKQLTSMLLQSSSRGLSFRKVAKNNNTLLDGVSLQDLSIAPTVYLQDYFKDYQEGRSLREIANKILKLISEIPEDVEENIQRLEIYKEVASLIFPTLINYEQNKDYLQNVPHRRFLDLAIVYKLSMDLEDGCRGMMTIPNAVLSNWGVSEEDIYEKAIENVKAQNSFAVLSMPEMLFRILDDRDLDLSKEMQEIEISKIMENCNWFVLSSNYSGVGGVAILLFPEIFCIM